MPRWTRVLGPALLVAGLAGAFPALAQDSGDDLRAEIEALKKGQEDIQKQLAELKRLLQQQRAPAAAPRRQGPEVKDVVFDLGSNDIKGSKDATLALIEFTDYQ